MKILPIALKFVAAYALIEKNRAVLIDTGLPDNEAHILQNLKKESIGPQDIKLIILTHAHPDHTGSAEKLREISGAPVGIHKHDAPFLRGGENAPVVPAKLLGHLMAVITLKANKRVKPQLEPDILFDESFLLEEYGFAGKVIATPGHTAGCVSIITDEGDAIVGDMLIKKFMGAGKAAFPLFATDRKQVVESLKTILAQKPRRCLTAHSGEIDVGEIEQLVQTIA